MQLTTTKVIISLLVLIGLRIGVSILPYSGASAPPKFGDYEAQRHWMEITTNLPISEWYFPTEENDLHYWGLDYPPLTAYHSWMMGQVSSWIEPESVALRTSRGHETFSHKIFMRATVIVVDICLLLPSLWYTVNALYREESTLTKWTVFLVAGTQPGLILIDNGHFQYNNVSLALSIFAMGLLLRQRTLLASFFFTCSLMYKQMSLYYAPAFFFALLAKSLGNASSPLQSLVSLAQIGATVILTVIACLLPFLVQHNPIEQLLQLFTRVFPIGRGLYEDKVANLWCSISPIFKLQYFAEQPVVIRICLVATLLGMAPAAVALLRSFWRFAKRGESTLSPTRLTFIIGTTCIAWSFFFFSFHVHEKSVLLPMMPMTLLFAKSPTLVTVANFISTLSMLPLLMRDGHEYSCLALSIAHVLFSIAVTKREEMSKVVVFLASLLPLLAYSLSKLLTPPAHYPDIFTLFLTATCFSILALCWLVLHLQIYLLDSFSAISTTPKKTQQLKKD